VDLEDKKFALYVYLNDSNRAKGFIYLSDGKTTLYQEGEHSLHELEFDGKGLQTTQKMGKDYDVNKAIAGFELFV